MYTFIICLILLVSSYFIYGKFIEKTVGVDANKETPAYKLEDGVDYIPMNKHKLFLIHFLNIAGLGPIFGIIQGALFGPAAFLWITFGTIFAGCVHDFFSGFLSIRNNGFSMPIIIEKFLGSKIRKFVAIITIIAGILVGANFSLGAAQILYAVTNVNMLLLIVIIFAYFFIATLFPVDKIIGKIYPIFGVLFILMTIFMFTGLFFSGIQIPELTTQGLYFTDKAIFPFLFVTIACGAISGFHSSQSPIVARCTKNELDMREIFFGAMLLEGVLALLWAAVAMSFFNYQPQIAAFYGSQPGIGVYGMAKGLLLGTNPLGFTSLLSIIGTIGVYIVIMGVVICPITTGDTALRSVRLIIADELSMKQDKLKSRLIITVPIMIIAFVLTFVDFNIVWRYLSWLQLIMATILLLASTVYLINRKKQYLITLLPAIFTTLVSYAYILQSSEGLMLDGFISNIIAIVATIITIYLFMYKFKFSKKESLPS